MSRPKGPSSKTPTYRLHKQSGLALVRLNGKTIYLGKFGTPESREKYDRVIGEWLVAGRAVAPVRSREQLTVTELIAAYWNHVKGSNLAKSRYQKEPAVLSNLRSAASILRRLYGATPVNDFGPLSLLAIQQEMKTTKVQTKGRDHLTWSRNHINAQVRRLVRMFEWGVSRELVEEMTYRALLTVPSLEKSPDVRETRKVRSVDDAHIDAVIEVVVPTVADMIRMQRYTGARPGEISAMRGCDIDTKADPDGRMWAYVPSSHKTAHLDKNRVIWLNEKAQEIVKRRLRPNLREYLFKPADAFYERHAKMAATRKHPISASNQLRAERRARVGHRVNFHEQYDATAYALAIKRGCRMADKLAHERDQQVPADRVIVPHWHPHQIRHTVATEIDRKNGKDAARCVLGHSSEQTTSIYTDPDVAKARQIMANVG